MRTQLKKIVLAAAFGLAMALTFSCSSDGGEPPHEHVWGEWEVVTPATCGAKGERKRTCTIDPSHLETEEIAQVTYTSTQFCQDVTNEVKDLCGGEPYTATQICDARDGKIYKSVVIGGKAWMAENLNYNVLDKATDVCYDNNPANCVAYGRLYNWSTAMGGSASSSKNPSGVQGVCPDGWHLPSDAEWNALTKFVNPSCSDNSDCEGAGTKLKATNGWNNNDDGSSGNGTDEFGFSALPGGLGYSDGSFLQVGIGSIWWSSTEESGTSKAYYRSMNFSVARVGRGNYDKTTLFSVRCVQD
ncbi:MAG: fibrobacter succinogenes major paralogous domain-containing protein [Fibromonadaceae bacterium]|jgi:uncharacterized protein (TIGR02145 family)|nr:fibrobacter succinogenes major paralogous domain-containing protein [Fibromonadaceae bacterium]